MNSRAFIRLRELQSVYLIGNFCIDEEFIDENTTLITSRLLQRVSAECGFSETSINVSNKAFSLNSDYFCMFLTTIFIFLTNLKFFGQLK